MEDLPEWQKGWLAGIVDGDGSIYGESAGNNFHRVAVSVGMMHELTIKTIAKITGIGSVHCREKTTPKKCKLFWKWEIKHRVDVYTFLHELLPFFLTKAKQAAIALEYAERRIAGISYNLEDKDLLIKLKDLNKTGGD